MPAIQIAVLIPPPLRSVLFAPADLERLRQLGEVRFFDADPTADREQAIAMLEDAEIAVGTWGTVNPATPGLLARAPRLRMWEHVAGSVKGMFGPHLEGRALTIASCAPAIADSVAEFALGALITGIRGFLPNASALRAAPRSQAGAGRRVFSSTIGVIGASQVGRRVLRLLQPLGPRVLVYDPFLDAAEAAALGAERCDDLIALCAACDAVTLHTPALPATLRMLGAAHFRAMPDHGVVVNTSRGACIDESALIAELRQGRLQAFLDVTDPEPAAMDNPLRTLPNCVYTSHIAGGPNLRMGRQAVDDIAAFLAGRSPLMPVTPDQLHRLA